MGYLTWEKPPAFLGRLVLILIAGIIIFMVLTILQPNIWGGEEDSLLTKIVYTLRGLNFEKKVFEDDFNKYGFEGKIRISHNAWSDIGSDEFELKVCINVSQIPSDWGGGTILVNTVNIPITHTFKDKEVVNMENKWECKEFSTKWDPTTSVDDVGNKYGVTLKLVPDDGTNSSYYNKNIYQKTICCGECSCEGCKGGCGATCACDNEIADGEICTEDCEVKG